MIPTINSDIPFDSANAGKNGEIIDKDRQKIKYPKHNNAKS
jgi:hypothetical protein